MRRLHLQTRRHWPLAVLGGSLLVGAAAMGLRLQALVRAQVPALLKAQLATALGRPVEFGAIDLRPNGVWVRDLRVLPGPGERVEPLRAPRLRVAVDWGKLLASRRVRLDSVDLDHARLVLTAPAPHAASQPWTMQVLALSRAGVGTLRLNDAAVRMLPHPGTRDGWTVAGLTGEVRLQPASFRYRGRAARFTSELRPASSLRELRIAGSGSAETLTVEQSEAAYQQGRVEASGSLQPRESAALMTVRVKHLPLTRLAKEIGIPASWAMKGDLTGEVSVDARREGLKKVSGAVRLDRGSVARGGSIFPWRSASAEVLWTPEHTSFRQAKVAGEGLLLTASADVTTAAGQPLTAGAFTAEGQVSADRRHAIGQLASLVSFRTAPIRSLRSSIFNLQSPAAGSAKASIGFRARGALGELAKATASGRMEVEGLAVRPAAGGTPVRLARLTADVRRTASELTLSNVIAEAAGVKLTGSGTILDDRPNAPGSFAMEGTLQASDMPALRRALPRSRLWGWVPDISAKSGGEVRFRAGGPTARPEQFWAEGHFTARQFRLAAASPAGRHTLSVPVETFQGAFRRADGKLTLSRLDLKSRSFTAGGTVVLDETAAQAALAADLHLETGDWRSLPAIPANILPQLTGGRMTADVTVHGPAGRLNELPVEGRLRLAGATYAASREGAPVIPVDEITARFRWARRVLEIPELSVHSPALDVAANGRIEPNGPAYTLALDLDARSEDAGALAERFTDQVRIDGGAARARMHLRAPMDDLAPASIAGALELTGARLRRPVEALGLEAIDVRSLSLDFERRAGEWEVRRAALEAPGLRARLAGSLTPARVDADVSLTAEKWSAPARWPLTGGTMTLEGHAAGPLDQPSEPAYRGTVAVDGASLRYASPGLAASGGSVRVHAAGEGPLRRLPDWLQSAEVAVSGARLTVSGRELPGTELQGRLIREGKGLRLTEGLLRTPGLTAHAGGTWTPAGHRIDVAAETRDPALLGFNLPQGITLGECRLQAAVAGTTKEPVQSADGRLEAAGLELAVGSYPTQSFSPVAGRFHYSGGEVRFERLEGRSELGRVSAAGAWRRDDQQVHVTVDGGDISRLALPLPDGVRSRAFHLETDLAGTASKPLSQAKGTLALSGVEFEFGPEGPHKLDRITGQLALDGKRVLVTDIRAAGPAGAFTGSGELSRGTYRFSLDIPHAHPALARWLLPGTVQGGKLSGTFHAFGYFARRDHKETPPVAVGGRFRLDEARYVLPPGLGMSGRPLAISSLTGAYASQGGHTTVKDLALNGDFLEGRGELTRENGKTRVIADLKTADLGRVAACWPQLAGLFRGGSASGKLDALFSPDGNRGALTTEARGGTLLLSAAPAEFVENPLREGSFVLVYEPGKLTFRDVVVRGPKANADGEGVWSEGGPVYGKGKAWFSSGFTAKLIKPSGWSWLAKLAGVREIKSGFALSGSADRLMLDAAITKSILWKFAKGRVPKEFRDIAAGKSPLWAAPVEVAEQPLP